MRWYALRGAVIGVALLAVLALTGTAAEEKKDEGFKPLFNGKDLAGWKTFLPNKDADPAKTWSVKDGVIDCVGLPNGYFYTEKSYKNYVIRYDWRYPKEQPEKSTFNSGLLVHIQEPHKVWPKCVEAQGAYANHGQLYFLGVQGMGGKLDMDAFKKTIKPREEWQTTEAICGADGAITVKINGVEVTSGKSPLTEGFIGFQSEGAHIQFRNIVLKEMK
jgi:hypothetical protein